MVSPEAMTTVPDSTTARSFNHLEGSMLVSKVSTKLVARQGNGAAARSRQVDKLKILMTMLTRKKLRC